MVGESDYVSRGKPAVSTDDSSSELGLDHSYAKGRPVIKLPEPTSGYDPELVGKSPDELAEHFAHQDADRDANNIEKIMKEVPGGRAPGSHSTSSGRIRRKRSSGGGISGQNVPFDGPDVYRPHVVAGRVSAEADRALRSQPTSPGEMINLLGETLHAGVSWAQLEWTLRDLRDRKRLARQSGEMVD